MASKPHFHIGNISAPKCASVRHLLYPHLSFQFLPISPFWCRFTVCPLLYPHLKRTELLRECGRTVSSDSGQSPSLRPPCWTPELPRQTPLLEIKGWESKWSSKEGIRRQIQISPNSTGLPLHPPFDSTLLSGPQLVAVYQLAFWKLVQIIHSNWLAVATLPSPIHLPVPIGQTSRSSWQNWPSWNIVFPLNFHIMVFFGFTFFNSFFLANFSKIQFLKSNHCRERSFRCISASQSWYKLKIHILNIFPRECNEIQIVSLKVLSPS